jgi:hypothetical protein
MHTPPHLSGPEEIPWKSHGAYTSTDAKGNTARPSYAQNDNPHYLNTHILEGCRYIAKLGIKRHNNPSRLLLQLPQNLNKGRWPIICVDMGHKPVTDFNYLMADTNITPHTQHQEICNSLQEGLQDDKSENPDYPLSIPDYVLQPQHIPRHYKPHLIRAVGFTLNTQGSLIKYLTYRGQMQFQIIECKYSTDGNIQTIIDHVYGIYELLRLALQTHDTLKADVKIIPIVINRTNTFHFKICQKSPNLSPSKRNHRMNSFFNTYQLQIRTSQWHSMYMHKNGYLIYLKTRENSSPQRQNRPRKLKPQH